MDANSLSDLMECASQVPDPRAANATHKLNNIIVIAVFAIISGCNSWQAVEAYGHMMREKLEEVLDLAAGIPSHDTFSRVFRLLGPEVFERFFQQMVQRQLGDTPERPEPEEQKDLLSAAVDGKTSRRSFQEADRKHPVHMVGAWCSELGVVLGQLATHEKSNEISAIPELLDQINLAGVVVTVDAMGCQKDIAARIIEGGGDYILQIKANQPTLERQAVDGFENSPIQSKSQTVMKKAHGRMESRLVETIDATTAGVNQEAWVGACSIIRLLSVRSVGEQSSVEDRYYLTSLGSADPDDLLRRCRGHWGIENRVHWSLDMTFREDHCRVREGHGAENFSRLRRLALNLLLPAKKILKTSLEQTRLMCTWNFQLMLEVVTGTVQPPKPASRRRKKDPKC